MSRLQPISRRACTDCLAVGEPAPEPRDGRSPRCRAHRAAYDSHLARGRARRARGHELPAEQWRAAYRPTPISSRPGALIDPAQLAQIQAVIADLTSATLAAVTATDHADDAITQGGTGEPELRAGLRQLRRAAHDAIDTLTAIPGLQRPTT